VYKATTLSHFDKSTSASGSGGGTTAAAVATTGGGGVEVGDGESTTGGEAIFFCSVVEPTEGAETERLSTTLGELGVLVVSLGGEFVVFGKAGEVVVVVVVVVAVVAVLFSFIWMFAESGSNLGLDFAVALGRIRWD